MAQGEDLTWRPFAPMGSVPACRWKFGADVIAAVALANKFNLRAPLAPLRSNQAPKPIYGRFVKARRFSAHESANKPRHALLLLAQVRKKIAQGFRRDHCGGYANKWRSGEQLRSPRRAVRI